MSKRALGLQARAQAARQRQAQSRVNVTRTGATAGEDGSQSGGTAEVWLYGTVGGYWWGFDSDEVARELRSLGDVDEILVRLHSFGGSAIEGIAIANLLANHPATVRVVCDGIAASAASMIALAGAELIMSPGAQLMVHDAWMVAAGNAAELRAEADWIDKQSENYAQTYAHRAGGTAAAWRQVMLANNGDGTWYSAQEAVDAGLADRVANIESATPPPPLPDPADLDDDLELAAAAAWDLDVLIHPTARDAWSKSRHARTPKPPSASAVGSTHTEGGSAVAFSNEQITNLRATLGLPETADEAAIVAAVSAVVEENVEERPASASIPDGHVVVPQAKLDDLERGAALGTKAAQTLHERDREAFLDANKAKYAAANRGAWAKEYDRDPEGTRAHFAEAPDLIPANLLGHEDDGVDRDDTGGHADVTKQPGYENWRF